MKHKKTSKKAVLEIQYAKALDFKTKRVNKLNYHLFRNREVQSTIGKKL